MAAKKNSGELEDVPFYGYLRQFYLNNRRKIRQSYCALTRKYLDFNDPDKGTDSFLRRPQFEALEMYVFLKEYCGNALLADIFRDWQQCSGQFEERGAFSIKGGELSMFEELDAPKFEAAFKKMRSYSAGYPNYIYALTMGLGKTVLMATCIFYEFLLANKFPGEARYCHNALVFAPDKTVLQSLKEIETFDKSKVVPPGYVKFLDENLKFHFLDDNSLSLRILENTQYNIVISNNQKIILKSSHKKKTAVDSLFAAERRYRREATGSAAIFAELDRADGEIESEEELIENQRFEMIKRMSNLGIYVDEAHHAFGKALEKDFKESGATSLRKTINELALCLRKAGTQVVACHNYTGTPYVNNMLLPEVVYAYSLADAIDNRYLKKAEVKGYSNAKSEEFVRIAIQDFWKQYGERRVEGMLPKIALFATDIEELSGRLRPAVEKVLGELGIPLSRILVNVGDDKLTTNDDLREFKNLDTVSSQKQFILLVNKGKEGWNCRSLFAVALHRTPKSRIFVLQATMRCLRAIGQMQETGTIYLSEENRQILAEELQNNFRINIEEFTGAGEKNKISVQVRMVPPPVTVKLKRIRKRYGLKELELKQPVDFRLGAIDPLKYEIVETRTGLQTVGREMGQKKVVEGAKECIEYSALTLTAEVARYLGKSCLAIRRTLEESKDGMEAIINAVNKYNEIVYDVIVPELFKAFYGMEEEITTEEIELRLVKPPKGAESQSALVAESYHVNPELLASMKDGAFAGYAAKSFHLDNYCFDSNPEFNFFKSVLNDEDIAHVYFTGMLTSDKTEFSITYIDPESNILRNYYPDFLIQKKDGTYVIIEIKGENKLDDPVVLAKAKSASELAGESRMKYMMIPGSLAGFGLHQPDKLPHLS